MKIAISLPDDLFRRIDERARALRLSRSALLAEAARRLLQDEDSTVDATEAWNRAIERGGQPSDDPAAAAAQRSTKALVRRRRGER